MDKLNKSVKTLFFWSLGLSIGFPCGVLGIVFGAVNKLWLLLVLGIILTVAGFYVMPILWVKYGEKRRYRSLLKMITDERILTVEGLSQQTGYAVKTVREMVKYLINKHYLTGYLFVGDNELKFNENRAKPPADGMHKCPNCGAGMTHDGTHFVCEYCGTRK